MAFTQKETNLLKDLKDQEEICIQKYGKYANSACDGELKNLFVSIRNTEQQHLNTINGLLGGLPNTNPLLNSNDTCIDGNCDGGPQNDKYLCQDALSGEKHVSSLYDTCIFEFSDINVRNTLNHIQKEEQQHGEKIYSYMSQHGMY